jgi:hypothetical protein
VYVLIFVSSAKSILSEIVADVQKLGSDALEDNVETLRDRSSMAGHGVRMVSTESIPPAMEFKDFVSTSPKRPLSSITDPLTGQAVEPPPYAQVMEVLDVMIDNNFDEKINPRMTKEEIIDVR